LFSKSPREQKRFYVAILFASALILYLLPAFLVHKTQTPPEAYYDQLAAAFLRGQLNISEPAVTYDLTLHAGRWYVAFPPLPAFLMVPWVAIFGGINTVVFSALVGALNVVLVLLLLQALSRQGWSSFSDTDNLWIAILFAFGTVHWVLSTQGTVWFLAQICALTFAALSVYVAVRQNSPLLAGAALALAMLARPNIILMAPLLLAVAVQHRRDRPSAQDERAGLTKWSFLAALPLLLAGAGLLLYNWLRFGALFDFGYRTANVAPQLVEELNQYGQFHIHYILQNLKIMLFATPEWAPGPAGQLRLAPNGLGMSLFLTTPAFLYLFFARRISALTIGAWISTGLLLLPLITYYNPGWHQFGYRFSLDFTIPLLVWLAAGLKDGPSWILKGLIVLSVLINAWGTVWFVGLY
jgi:hypothetical protein